VLNWSGTNHDYGLRTSQHINPDKIIAREEQKYHCASCPLGCGGLCRSAEAVMSPEP
jgi:aldehyde:ferredoxin oxidoreductase